MVQTALMIRAQIASPGDLIDERKAVTEVIHAWNATHALSRRAYVEPVKWETHSVPLQGDRPQALINKQLGDTCDFLIVLFWTRFGTETGTEPSGTIEEIKEFMKAGKPVLMYFSKRPTPPDNVDSKQLEQVRAFKKQIQNDKTGLYGEFADVHELREKLSSHINHVVDDIVSKSSWSSEPVAFRHGSTVNPKQIFFQEFAKFLRESEVQWRTEKNSAPISLDDSKAIMGSVAIELMKFASLSDEAIGGGIGPELEQLAAKAKRLSNYTVYLGPRAHEDFFDNGDQLLQQLRDALQGWNSSVLNALS